MLNHKKDTELNMYSYKYRRGYEDAKYAGIKGSNWFYQPVNHAGSIRSKDSIRVSNTNPKHTIETIQKSRILNVLAYEMQLQLHTQKTYTL